MNQADQEVSTHRRKLEEQYGFVADPSKPLWKNAMNALSKITTSHAPNGSSIKNLASHNVLMYSSPPAGYDTLLGLGLNYCIKPPSSIKSLDPAFKRLENDVRRIYTFSKSPPADDEYDPKMYIKSNFKFKEATPEIEQALKNFKSAFIAEQLATNQRRQSKPNLTSSQHELMLSLKDNDKYTVIAADKTRAPILTEREIYIGEACRQHLGNERNYRQLTKREADFNMQKMKILLYKWLSKHKENLPVHVDRYLATAAKKYYGKYPRFRMTGKMHKRKPPPPPMRPIVCCAGTLMNSWSTWLSSQFAMLRDQVKSYVKDSQQILDETRALRLPPNAFLYTADAVAMFNNIDTDHAIHVILKWLDYLDEKGLLPDGFNLQAVKEAMVLIMRNNVFEFGNLYFLQLIGTAMGTSSASDWATIYFWTHEFNCLEPKHGKHHLYRRRFLDDVKGIWTGNHTNEWEEYKKDMNNFGILKWEFSELSHKVDFLDLTISIENGRIVTKTYQKPLNLFLYLPPSSAHPPGCIKGTVYGLIGRYYAQNTHRKDYLYFVQMLYRHLLDRGWERQYTRQLILDAAANIEAREPKGSKSSSPDTDNTNDRLFFHLQYHPDDISRKRIQELYQEHCGELFLRELNIQRPTIAYSRPPNLGEFVTKAKLHQAPGRTASTIMGEYKAGLDPA